MTESTNDNIPTVDKIVYIEAEQDDQVLISDADNDTDDLHVCRKCNRVFKSLEAYIEHKVKYENYRISQTRSKLDRRMVLPQLVQKQKRKEKKEKAEDESKIEDINISKPASLVIVGCELPFVKNGRQEEDVVEVKQEDNLVQEQLPKKRGRKRKSLASEAQPSLSDLEITYICTVCSKKFRREATLRWHIKYEHKDDKENGEDSDEELIGEALSEKDKDFKVLEKEEDDDHQFDEDESKRTQEIHVIIEQPQNLAKLLETQDFTDKSSQLGNQTLLKMEKESGDHDSERPYSCDVCGRRFKELTVLKAHAVVHSDERKFVCTVENCPYGFKTKGGLVRHMRRHTGERPYACENCGRAFSESGALTRHMKSRRNCAQTPDSAYPRYMKNWTYHPNIPAVLDPSQRDVHQGRSTLEHPIQMAKSEETEGEIHYLITGPAETDVITAEIIAPHDATVEDVPATLINPTVIVPHLIGGSKPALEVKVEQEDTIEVEEWNGSIRAVANKSDVIAEVVHEIKKPVASGQSKTASVQQATDDHTGSADILVLEPTNVDPLHDSDLMNLKNNSEIQFMKLTQCRVCRKDLGTMEGLEIHLRSHLADQPSRCGLCHFLSHDREELRHHILSMHYESLNDIEASVLAMEEEEGGVKLQASQDKKSVTRDALVAVKQLYSLKKQKPTTEVVKSCPTASGTLQCMVCNRFFRGSSYLRQHMRTHTGDRPHQCHVCHRSFTSRDILKKHMYVHKDQRDFKCGECGKLFKRLAHVQQHLRIHCEERTFRCSVCDKLFKTQNSLTVHVRTHSGVNPYKCHVCNRHFRERGSLQRHMRLHTGEKPYKCPHCNRAFAEHGTLSRHHKAKAPCSGNRIVTYLSHNQAGSSTMLTQFSTVVANTQQYMQHTENSQQYMHHAEDSQKLILPAVQEMNEEYVVLDTTGKQSEIIENVEVITEEGITLTARPDGDFDGQETETLQIFDTDTGESVIIVAEKSIVDLIKEQQLSPDTGSSLQKIKDILHAAGNVTSVIKGDFSIASEQQEVACSEPKEEAEPGEQLSSENHGQAAASVSDLEHWLQESLPSFRVRTVATRKSQI